MTLRIPAYVDSFLAAVAAGSQIEHVHLGHWDAPEAVGRVEARHGFGDAQERLSARLLQMLEIGPGQRVLDIACGLGGTSRLVKRLEPSAEVIGLNLDARQIAAARRYGPSRRGLGWIVADACRLPFAAGSFDRLICVEAAFHFASRRDFLAEAHRVLAPGSRMVTSDIALTRPPSLSDAAVEAIEAEYGPWPAMWVSGVEIARTASEAGFRPTVIDASANTWPSYHTIAPPGANPAKAAAVMRDLHRGGFLRYLYVALERRG